MADTYNARIRRITSDYNTLQQMTGTQIAIVSDVPMGPSGEPIVEDIGQLFWPTATDWVLGGAQCRINKVSGVVTYNKSHYNELSTPTVSLLSDDTPDATKVGITTDSNGIVYIDATQIRVSDGDVAPDNIASLASKKYVDDSSFDAGAIVHNLEAVLDKGNDANDQDILNVKDFTQTGDASMGNISTTGYLEVASGNTWKAIVISSSTNNEALFGTVNTGETSISSYIRVRDTNPPQAQYGGVQHTIAMTDQLGKSTLDTVVGNGDTTTKAMHIGDLYADGLGLANNKMLIAQSNVLFLGTPTLPKLALDGLIITARNGKMTSDVVTAPTDEKDYTQKKYVDDQDAKNVKNTGANSQIITISNAGGYLALNSADGQKVQMGCQTDGGYIQITKKGDPADQNILRSYGDSVISQSIKMGKAPTDASHLTRKDYVDGQDNKRVPNTGYKLDINSAEVGVAKISGTPVAGGIGYGYIYQPTGSGYPSNYGTNFDFNGSAGSTSPQYSFTLHHSVGGDNSLHYISYGADFTVKNVRKILLEGDSYTKSESDGKYGLKTAVAANTTSLTPVSFTVVPGYRGTIDMSNCYMIGKMVVMNFRLKQTGGLASGEILATIPVGFRPTSTILYGGFWNFSGTPNFNINTTGTIITNIGVSTNDTALINLTYVIN